MRSSASSYRDRYPRSWYCWQTRKRTRSLEYADDYSASRLALARRLPSCMAATRATGIVSALLMLVFIAGIASAWARGLAIDCGCFGTGGPVDADETAYGLDIARDLGFMALGLFLAIWPRSRFALDGALGLYPDSDRER